MNRILKTVQICWYSSLTSTIYLSFNLSDQFRWCTNLFHGCLCRCCYHLLWRRQLHTSFIDWFHATHHAHYTSCCPAQTTSNPSHFLLNSSLVAYALQLSSILGSRSTVMQTQNLQIICTGFNSQLNSNRKISRSKASKHCTILA